MLVLALLGIFLLGLGLNGLRDQAPTPSLSAVAPGGSGDTTGGLDVVALGRLAPGGGIVALAPPGGANDARIGRLLVAEGDRIAAGQVVAELDTLPQLLALKTRAEASVAVQEVSLEQVRAVVRLSLAEAKADHTMAETARDQARRELDRVSRLAESGAASLTLLEQVQAAATKAGAELERTAALVARYGGDAASSQVDILLAERNLALARDDLARTVADLAAGLVAAPEAGTVLEIMSRAGERPGDAGVMTIGNTDRMEAELEVYQTDIRSVRPGMAVTMTASALPQSLAGEVVRIGHVIGRQSIMSGEPAANADARVVRVTVALDPASSEIARRYTNLEVVGRIGMGPDSGPESSAE